MFHTHKWEGEQQQRGESVGAAIEGAQYIGPITLALYRCRCGERRTDMLRGHWQLGLPESLEGDAQLLYSLTAHSLTP